MLRLFKIIVYVFWFMLGVAKLLLRIRLFGEFGSNSYSFIFYLGALFLISLVLFREID